MRAATTLAVKQYKFVLIRKSIDARRANNRPRMPKANVKRIANERRTYS